MNIRFKRLSAVAVCVLTFVTVPVAPAVAVADRWMWVVPGTTA